MKRAKIQPLNRKKRKSSGKSEISRKAPIQMSVVRLHTLQKEHKGQRHPSLLSYTMLKKRGELMDWRYVPPDSTVIYVSREWTGNDHPDPDGTQMYHLLLTLERLQRGDISQVSMSTYHTLVYKHKYTTTSQQWSKILNSSNTFVFLEFCCVPAQRREDWWRSIPEFVRRCSFMIILVPGCTHSDRIDPRTQRKMNLCYRRCWMSSVGTTSLSLSLSLSLTHTHISSNIRFVSLASLDSLHTLHPINNTGTYRMQARCVLEMFSAFLNTKDIQQPQLLVRSGTETPEWISPFACQVLAVGLSVFECCESNHKYIQCCLRDDTRDLLDRMIQDRSDSLFDTNHVVEARFSMCLRNYWCRGLIDFESSRKKWISLEHFKKDLQWSNDDDKVFTDREGFSLLAYAATSDCVLVVEAVLSEIEKSEKMSQRCNEYIQAGLPRKVINLGIAKLMTPLMGAMIASRPKIVSILLEHGADPFATDSSGHDALVFASTFGRVENVKFWLDRFPKWDLERKNKIVGGTALGSAVYMGPDRLKLFELLVDRGALLDVPNHSGASLLMQACANEDCDPRIVSLLCKRNKSQDVNVRRYGRTLKWRNIYRLARFLTWTTLSRSAVMISLSRACGSTALHYAVRRGDTDVVNLLLRYGADSTIKNNLGKSPVDYCDAFPELKGGM